MSTTKSLSVAAVVGLLVIAFASPAGAAAEGVGGGGAVEQSSLASLDADLCEDLDKIDCLDLAVTSGCSVKVEYYVVYVCVVI